MATVTLITLSVGRSGSGLCDNSGPAECMVAALDALAAVLGLSVPSSSFSSGPGCWVAASVVGTVIWTARVGLLALFAVGLLALFAVGAAWLLFTPECSSCLPASESMADGDDDGLLESLARMRAVRSAISHGKQRDRGATVTSRTALLIVD